jgi:hypothetical protein
MHSMGCGCSCRAPAKGWFSSKKNLQNDIVTLFVVIWQILSNHDLIRLKRFVSSISSKLCN